MEHSPEILTPEIAIERLRSMIIKLTELGEKIKEGTQVEGNDLISAAAELQELTTTLEDAVQK